MASQVIPSPRSGCTKEGHVEAEPQSTSTRVSVLTHSAAFSFLSDCIGTALTPPHKLFFLHAVSSVVFQELSGCPHVSPPPLGCCVFYRSNRLLWCCPSDLMRKTPTTMCMCFFLYYLAVGFEGTHLSQTYIFVSPLLPVVSQLIKLFPLPAPHLHPSLLLSMCGHWSPHPLLALPGHFFAALQVSFSFLLMIILYLKHRHKDGS